MSAHPIYLNFRPGSLYRVTWERMVCGHVFSMVLRHLHRTELGHRFVVVPEENGIQVEIGRGDLIHLAEGIPEGMVA